MNHRQPLLRALSMLLGAALLFVGSPTTGPRASQSPPRAQPPAVANPHGEIRISCEVCHTADSWTVIRPASSFDHGTTGYPLLGQHRSAACMDCHRSTVFSRVATSCADCHRDVHDGRNGQRCQDCHRPTRWVDERTDAVRRHASTSFPLRGMHAFLECTRCHVGTGEAHLVNVSSECIACHADDLAAAVNPSHAGFSTQCEVCHDDSRTTWAGAGFDHTRTGFALTGAHRSTACADCHSGGTYAGTPRDCYACHRAAYEATSNPNHTAAGFPAQCASCHSTSTWSGARFDHDPLFRIYSGRHREEWTSCTDCHQNPSRYADFTCLTCHQQTQTDDHHREVTGYRYESVACYTCHRNV